MNGIMNSRAVTVYSKKLCFQGYTCKLPISNETNISRIWTSHLDAHRFGILLVDFMVLLLNDEAARKFTKTVEPLWFIRIGFAIGFEIPYCQPASYVKNTNRVRTPF